MIGGSTNSTGAGALREGTVVGGYTLGRQLGAGEMGDVYRATGKDGAEVAIKILKLGMAGPGSEIEQRFAREAKLCAALQHPNLVSVSDHGTHEGAPFFVMPLLRGVDLDGWLLTTGPLCPEVAVAIVLQACAGVRAAHEAGVVHRDLKPANIFLDETNEEIRTVVCDFGVAKVRDEDGSLTASGAVLGTPLYMSPEQLINSKRVDARCDVWALGMVLYHALAGTSAFHETRSIGDLILALNQNAVPPIQQRAPWVSPALARVVHAALLPLDKRLATVRDLEEALLRWAPGERRLTRDKLAPIPQDRKAQVATLASLPADARELDHQADDTLVDPKLPAADAQTEPADTYVGRTLAGRYRIVVRIGSGGMGAVYEAIDTEASEDPRVVALKVMHPEAGARATETIRRFLREAKASSRIESAHVARFIDSGVDPSTGAPFIVMERLRGRDLATHLATSGALDVGPTIALFLQACDALASRARARHRSSRHQTVEPLPARRGLDHHAQGMRFRHRQAARQRGRSRMRRPSSRAAAGSSGHPSTCRPSRRRARRTSTSAPTCSAWRSRCTSLSRECARGTDARAWARSSSRSAPRTFHRSPRSRRGSTSGSARSSPRRWSATSRSASRRYASLATALERFADRQTVTQEDLVAMPVARRSLVVRPTTSGDATHLDAKATGDAVSVTANDETNIATPPGRRRRWPAVVAIGVVLAGAAGVTFAVRGKPDRPITQVPPQPAQGALGVVSAFVPPVASSAPPVEKATIAASASASASAPSSLPRLQRPRGDAPAVDGKRAGTTSTTSATSVTPPATPVGSAGSTVGRGGTATDLPIGQ